MAKRTYQGSLQFLVVSFIVKAVLQAIGILSLNNVSIPSTMTPYNARNTTISDSPGMPTVSSQEAGDKTTLYSADASIPAIGNITNFPSSLSPFVQTTQSSHMEMSRPSESTAETTTEVTDFPTEAFVSHSTYQSSEVPTTAVTQKASVQPSTTGSLFSSTVLHSVLVSQLPAPGARMKVSEFILTVAFALILTLTILGLLVYFLNKFRMRRAQYSHRQLDDTSFDTVDSYASADDTLVISGGLYDAPRMYNSSMTTYDDELQTDHLPFRDQPGQFRLEFFGEKENGISLTSESLQVPPGSL